jgi:hypothetical protein
MLIAGMAGSAEAADVVTIDATNGSITFNHKAHQGRVPCTACHKDASPTRLHLQKDFAHRLCRGCHEIRRGSAPVKCDACHRK